MRARAQLPSLEDKLEWMAAVSNATAADMASKGTDVYRQRAAGTIGGGTKSPNRSPRGSRVK